MGQNEKPTLDYQDRSGARSRKVLPGYKLKTSVPACSSREKREVLTDYFRRCHYKFLLVGSLLRLPEPNKRLQH